MNVAYLVNCYPRVSHTFIRREIAGLEAHGLRIGRFGLRQTPDELVDDADKLEQAKVRVVLDVGAPRLLASLCACFVTRPARACSALLLALRMGARSQRGVVAHLAYLAEATVLRRWLEQGEYSHVHAHFGTNPTTVALLTHRLGGPPYSFTAHGPEEFDDPVALGLPEKIAHAAFVVAVSSYGQSQLYRRCRHAHWSKVHVVHCGLDAELLEAEPSPIPDCARLVSVARLSEQKGQLLLIEAMARLRADHVEFDLVLVGDGELRSELEARIAQLGLSDRITITGWADSSAVRAHIESGRVFVLPSFAEGLPVALMEALALGRPVVTTNVAGIAELVTDECGWLIPAGSVDALYVALREALSAPLTRLEAMAAVGRRRVRERHSAYEQAGVLASLFRRP